MRGAILTVAVLAALSPARAAERGAGGGDPKLMREYVDAVEGYVEQMSADQEDNRFPLEDEKAGKTWRLEMLRIHKDRIVRLGRDVFFACADFREKSGKRSTDLDLDFYVRRGDDGWEVEEVLVHKVNGSPRYTYNSKNQRVPARAERKAQPRQPLRRMDLGERAPASREDPASAPPPALPPAPAEHPQEHPAQEHPSGGHEHPR